MIEIRILARVAILGLVSGLGLSCSTMASIERRSGPTMEARIDGSDSVRLYVTDADDARYSIDRSDIVEIQHPGRPAMTTGAILLAAAATSFALTPLLDRADNGMAIRLDVIAILLGVSFVTASIPPLLYGLGINMRSREAAKVRLRAPLPGSAELPRLACPSCQ